MVGARVGIWAARMAVCAAAAFAAVGAADAQVQTALQGQRIVLGSVAQQGYAVQIVCSSRGGSDIFVVSGRDLQNAFNALGGGGRVPGVGFVTDRGAQKVDLAFVERSGGGHRYMVRAGRADLARLVDLIGGAGRLTVDRFNAPIALSGVASAMNAHRAACG